MPQLDTIYVFMVFLWTWLILYLLNQESSATLMLMLGNRRVGEKYVYQAPMMPWT